MPIGKAKAPKAPKEKKPKKEKPPKEKKVKKGKDVPEEVDETGQEKKKKFPILMLIPAVVILAAAVIIFVFVLPGRNADKDPEATASVEPVPPVLPTELPVGDEIVPGMVLEADEFAAQAVLAKTITYTYTDLVDAGKAAETYVKQLKTADPRYYVVDEELVRQREEPDYSAAEGLVLMARPLPKPEPETPESAPPRGERRAGELRRAFVYAAGGTVGAGGGSAGYGDYGAHRLDAGAVRRHGGRDAGQDYRASPGGKRRRQRAAPHRPAGGKGPDRKHDPGGAGAAGRVHGSVRGVPAGRGGDGERRGLYPHQHL